jgi:hypothetical protein
MVTLLAYPCHCTSSRSARSTRRPPPPPGGASSWMLAYPTSSRTRGASGIFPSASWQLSSTCTTSCSPKTRRMPAISASSLVAVLQSSLSSNLATSSTPGRPSTSPGSPDDLQTHPDATWNFPDLRSLSTYAGSSSPHEQEGYATCSWSVAAARGTSAHAVAARLGYPSIDSTVASRGHSAHVPAARFDQDRHRAPAPPATWFIGSLPPNHSS